jgi:sugar lactone lactonase YvrE
MKLRVQKRQIALLAVALACASCVSACVLDRKGMVFMVDRSYRPNVVGSTDDGFSVPDGILWRNGSFVMADEGGHAVRVWKSAVDVTTLCDAKDGIREPEDLAFDDQGNLYFTDDEAGGVWEVNRNGRAFLLAGRNRGLLSTEGIVVAPSGEILVGDGERHEVFSVSRTGKVSVFLGTSYGITKPESMTYDDRGNLYIGDNVDDVVYMLDRNMKLSRLIDNRENFSPEGILYANHVLYITDSKNGKLSRFTPADGLQTIAVFAGTLRRVCGITTDDDGTIFVSIQSGLENDRGYLVGLEPDPRLSRLIVTREK